MQFVLIGEDVDPEGDTDAVAVHPPAAAMSTVLAAANANPAAAAFDALEQATRAVGDPDVLLSALRDRFGLD